MNVKLTNEERIVLLKMLRDQNNNVGYKLLIYVIIILEIKVINQKAKSPFLCFYRYVYV